jgi:hypothetical protein
MLLGAEVAAEYPRVPEMGYDQPGMVGLRPPLRQRTWEAFRGLFVRARKADVRADANEDGEPERPPGIAPTGRGAP